MAEARKRWLRDVLRRTDSPAEVVRLAGGTQREAVKRCRCSPNLVSKVLARRTHTGKKVGCVQQWAVEITGLKIDELFPNRRARLCRGP